MLKTFPSKPSFLKEKKKAKLNYAPSFGEKRSFDITKRGWTSLNLVTPIVVPFSLFLVVMGKNIWFLRWMWWIRDSWASEHYGSMHLRFYGHLQDVQDSGELLWCLIVGHLVSKEENGWSLVPISNEEISWVVMEVDGYLAVDPNGVPSGLYRAFWDVIMDDVALPIIGSLRSSYIFCLHS